MNTVDVTADIEAAYTQWARSRDLDDAPPALVPFWVSNGFVNNTFTVKRTWAADTTNTPIEVTAFGDTSRSYIIPMLSDPVWDDE